MYPMLDMRLALIVFLNDTAPTQIYTLSLHDALPICTRTPLAFRGTPSPTLPRSACPRVLPAPDGACLRVSVDPCGARSEEHTSELQSRRDLVCRLLLDKKKEGIQSLPYQVADLGYAR